MLMEDRVFRKLTGFNPLLEEMELRALWRLAIGERAQLVDMSEDALQPYVPCLRWPRNDDPHPPPLLYETARRDYWISSSDGRNRLRPNPIADFTSRRAIVQ